MYSRGEGEEPPRCDRSLDSMSASVFSLCACVGGNERSAADSECVPQTRHGLHSHEASCRLFSRSCKVTPLTAESRLHQLVSAFYNFTKPQIDAIQFLLCPLSSVIVTSLSRSVEFLYKCFSPYVLITDQCLLSLCIFSNKCIGHPLSLSLCLYLRRIDNVMQ